MSDSALEALKEQLRSDNEKTRRKACQQLGKLGDPAAIPLLVRVYKDAGEDPKVQEAAAEALKRYARQIPGEGGASRTVQLLVYGLAALFVILLLGNIALRLGGSEEESVATDLDVPTPREELIAQYQTLLTEAQADFAIMRQEWGLEESGNLTCNVSLNRPQAQQLREVDHAVYPDFNFVSRLNLAIDKLNLQVIRLYDLACSDGTRGTVEQDIAASAALDTIEIDLQTVATQITEAINNPLPTLVYTTPLPAEAQTATANAPTLPPSETPVPTETPTPAPLVITPSGQ